MRKQILRLFIICGSLPFAALGETITHEQLFNLALSNSPLAKELEAEIATKRAEALAIRTIENPELSGEVKPFVSNQEGSDTEYEISLTQPLKLSSFVRRARVARLIEQSSDVERKLKFHELNQNLLLLYGKAWALQEKCAFGREAAAEINTLYQEIKQGASKGIISESTEQLFLAESRRLESDLKGLEADRGRAIAALMRNTGASVRDYILLPLTLPKVIESMAIKTSAIPLKERIELRRRLAHAHRELASLDSFPRFAPRLGFEHTEDGADRIIAGFSIELPLWDRNQAERRRTRALSDFHEAESKYYSADLFSSEQALLLDSVRASTAQAESYHKEILPALRKALGASQRELREGQANALQVWQILKELLNAQDRYLEMWIKALSERVELSILLGSEI